MFVLFQFTFLLYTFSSANGVCFSFNCSEKVNLSGHEKFENCSMLKWSEFNKCHMLSTLILSHNSISSVETFPEATFQNLVSLDMSDNKLTKLPDDFLQDAKDLVELNLSKNRLNSLPPNFLKNSLQLNILNLQENQLSDIPSTIFHHGLQNVTFDCTCSLAHSVTLYKKNICQNYTNCHQSFNCKTASGWSRVDDFYKEKCGPPVLLALYIAVPIGILVFVLSGGLFFVCWRNKKSTFLESKENSDKSPARSQPRYMTRTIDSMSTASNQHRCSQDYENIFVSEPIKTNHLKPYEYIESEPSNVKSSTVVEEDIYLESDANEIEQPVYSNTQPIYYSYTTPNVMNCSNKEDEDVYIIPDQ
ncbi:leucine-rich repeat-containing protein 25 [Spea bombifrons]|uniref:leucine-rich repeat-containing protein 25 n=1 Tax=Spea bombifrons TaxID=233779 RepID=UPI00234AEB22|nr:leucine-rich repeat-containing protein 25 [Spea bombifrons]